MPAIVVDAGLAIVTNRIMGTGAEPKFVHWGTGTTAPVPGNTALQTPRSEARVQGVSSRVQTNAPNDTYQVIGTLTATGNAAITEVGTFDASTGGNMMVRGTFAPINVEADDSIQFTVKSVFDQG